MKKITTLFFCIFCMLSVANAQDITVFDFDGTTPTFSNGGGGDTFASDVNPLSDAVNSSANVGKLTHNGQWTSGNSTTVDIDSKLYTSYEVSVYSPNSTTGKVQIECKDASDRQLDWYEQTITSSTGWIKFTRNLNCVSRITKVTVFFNNGVNSTSTAADIVYLDNVVFKKSTSSFQPFYCEKFFASWSLYGNWSGVPSTQANSWFGGVNLQTEGDATMNLEQWWGDNGHILKMNPTAAAVIIPDINVAGYDSLKLSANMTWPWSSAEQTAGYYGASDADKSPLIDVKIGTGNWVPVPTSALTQSWATPVILLKDGSGNPISNVSTISIRLSHTPFYTAVYDNVKILGKVHVDVTTSLSGEKKDVFMVYPNPATNYILAKNAQKVTITDLNGRIVTEAFNAEKVDVSSLAKGAYIVKAQIENATKIGKLIKQ